MVKKIDVLSDLITGKTKKCCNKCKNFLLSNDVLSKGLDGLCLLDKDKNENESFCFTFEVCNRFEYKNLDDYLNDIKCSSCNSDFKWTYYNGYLGLTCSNKHCWTHNLIYIDFENKETINK